MCRITNLSNYIEQREGRPTSTPTTPSRRHLLRAGRQVGRKSRTKFTK